MRRRSFPSRGGRGWRISSVLTLALAFASGAAHADYAITLKWSATTGDGVPGSNLIGGQPGDQLTLDVFLAVDERGVVLYQFSLLFDGDLLDELDFVSVTNLPPPGMDEIGEIAPELFQESHTPGPEGIIVDFHATTGGPPGPVSAAFHVAQIVFEVTGNAATDNDECDPDLEWTCDARVAFWNIGVDGIWDNASAPVPAEEIQLGNANVDRGSTTAPPPPPCGDPTGSGPGTPHVLNPATDYDAVQTPRDGGFDSLNQTLTTINNFSTGSSLYRSVLEFDLQGLPDGEEIRDAALTLRRVSTGGVDGVDVFGFPADGVASIADASNAVVRLATNIDADFTSYLTLDGEYLRCFLQSLVETGETHAGFLLMISGEPLPGTNSRAFSSSEGVIPPVLSLTTGEPAPPVPALAVSGRGALATLLLLSVAVAAHAVRRERPHRSR